MGSIGNTTSNTGTVKPSDFVRDNRIGSRTSNKMETYNIIGMEVKTNYGAIQYPMLTGEESGYRRVEFGKSDAQTFNELVEQGYTNIRFAEMSTRVRGYHEIYYKAK